ncbi:MAG: twin-arginine translocation signal domain-containing protein, partial [candidate division NC10 bacterium]|nr:twin-arginine translocation signal domain-containing protein [candidate division NC10 bacterium]
MEHLRRKEAAVGRRVSRRDFLKLAGMAGLGTALVPEDLFAQYRYLAPVSVPNP